MFNRDLFFYFEILAYLLGLSAILGWASAIYLTWQRMLSECATTKKQRQLPQLNDYLSAGLKNRKNLFDFPNWTLWRQSDRFLGKVWGVESVYAWLGHSAQLRILRLLSGLPPAKP